MTKPQPSADVSISPIQIVTSDHYSLGATVYERREFTPVADVLVHAAMAAPQRYYAPFATYLARRGFRVVTYAYRGLDASRRGPLRGFDATIEDWFERDAPAAARFVDASGDGRPFFAIGHSLGGQLVGTLAEGRRPDAIVQVTSQSGYYRTFDARWSMYLRWKYLVPALTEIFGYLPAWAGLGADAPKAVIRAWAGWNLHPEYFLSDHPEYAHRLATYEGPVYALSFSDDDYAPLTNVRWLVEHYRSARVLHHHLSPESLDADRIGHFGAFRADREDDVWASIGAFLRASVEGEDPLVAARQGTRWSPACEPTASWRDLDEALLADLRFGRV